MQNDSDLVKLSKVQQIELVDAIKQVSQATERMEEMAKGAKGALRFMGIDRALQLFLSAVIAGCGLLIWLWLNSNFVSSEVNAALWEKEQAKSESAWATQYTLNRDLVTQIHASSTAIATNVETNEATKRRLTRLETELEKLKDILMKQ